MIKFLEFKKEIRVINQIAIPTMASQISHLLMGFTDSVMAGRFSHTDLSGVAVGSGIWLPISLFFVSVISGMTPLIARYNGAGDKESSLAIYKNGTYLAIFLGIITQLMLLLSSQLVFLLKGEKAMLYAASEYLKYVSWGMLPFMLYQSVRSYFEANAFTMPVMFVSIGGFLLNIPINYIFIYGKLGAPALGGAGCGVATASVMWFMWLSLLIIKNFYFNKKTDVSTVSKKTIFEILKLGFPIGVTTFLEVFVFSIGAVMLSPFGTNSVAAHQIALNFLSIVFMIPMSYGIAVSVRVSDLIGQKKFQKSTLSWKSGIGAALLLAVIVSLITFIFSEQIVHIYTKDQETLRFASTLLKMAAVFHILDAFQVSANFTLRGYHNSTASMYSMFLAHWLIGLPTAIILTNGYITKILYGVYGFWTGLMIGIICSAVAMGTILFTKYNYKTASG